MRSGRDMWLSYAKEIVLISSVVSAQCMNVTDKQTDHRTVTSIPLGEIAYQQNLTNNTGLLLTTYKSADVLVKRKSCFCRVVL